MKVLLDTHILPWALAQALSEGVKFMSHDDTVAKYGDIVIPV